MLVFISFITAFHKLQILEKDVTDALVLLEQNLEYSYSGFEKNKRNFNLELYNIKSNRTFLKLESNDPTKDYQNISILLAFKNKKICLIENVKFRNEDWLTKGAREIVFKDVTALGRYFQNKSVYNSEPALNSLNYGSCEVLNRKQKNNSMPNLPLSHEKCNETLFLSNGKKTVRFILSDMSWMEKYDPTKKLSQSLESFLTKNVLGLKCHEDRLNDEFENTPDYVENKDADNLLKKENFSEIERSMKTDDKNFDIDFSLKKNNIDKDFNKKIDSENNETVLTNQNSPLVEKFVKTTEVNEDCLTKNIVKDNCKAKTELVMTDFEYEVNDDNDNRQNNKEDKLLVNTNKIGSELFFNNQNSTKTEFSSKTNAKNIDNANFCTDQKSKIEKHLSKNKEQILDNKNTSNKDSRFTQIKTEKKSILKTDIEKNENKIKVVNEYNSVVRTDDKNNFCDGKDSSKNENVIKLEEILEIDNFCAQKNVTEDNSFLKNQEVKSDNTYIFSKANHLMESYNLRKAKLKLIYNPYIEDCYYEVYTSEIDLCEYFFDKEKSVNSKNVEEWEFDLSDEIETDKEVIYSVFSRLFIKYNILMASEMLQYINGKKVKQKNNTLLNFDNIENRNAIPFESQNLDKDKNRILVTDIFDKNRILVIDILDKNRILVTDILDKNKVMEKRYLKQGIFMDNKTIESNINLLIQKNYNFLVLNLYSSDNNEKITIVFELNTFFKNLKKIQENEKFKTEETMQRYNFNLIAFAKLLNDFRKNLIFYIENVDSLNTKIKKNGYIENFDSLNTKLKKNNKKEFNLSTVDFEKNNQEKMLKIYNLKFSNEEYYTLKFISDLQCLEDYFQYYFKKNLLQELILTKKNEKPVKKLNYKKFRKNTKRSICAKKNLKGLNSGPGEDPNDDEVTKPSAKEKKVFIGIYMFLFGIILILTLFILNSKPFLTLRLYLNPQQ